jgi:hypothetical protein
VEPRLLAATTATPHSPPQVPLDAGSHRTGDVWHAQLEGLPGSGVLYGYKVAGEGGWETGNRCVCV